MNENLQDLNAHLADLITDIGRVRDALNGDGFTPAISVDEIKNRLSDVSNALDDLYNAAVGI